MSKPKYDVKRIPQEVFDRWHKETVTANYLQQTNMTPIDRRLVDAACVPEPTAAELENSLIDQLVGVRGTNTPWLNGKIEEIRVARAREAKESDK